MIQTLQQCIIVHYYPPTGHSIFSSGLDQSWPSWLAAGGHGTLWLCCYRLWQLMTSMLWRATTHAPLIYTYNGVSKSFVELADYNQ